MRHLTALRLFPPSVNWDDPCLLWLDTEYIQETINSQELALRRGQGGLDSPDFGIKQTGSNPGSAPLLLCDFEPGAVPL